MWHTGQGMGWWMLFGGAMWLLLCAAIVYLVVQVARGWGRGEVSGERPVDIARRRYAAGELTKAQFEQLRRDLSDRAA